MNALQILVGLLIKKAEIIQDYFQLIFPEGTILNIYNKYQYDGGSVLALEGKKLISVVETNNKIVLDFGDSGRLSVGLLDEDYNGPEAIELIRKGEPPIIWQ
jgi:hypothetical protein